MSNVTYKYEAETQIITFYIDDEYFNVWDCGDVGPEDAFNDFMEIFNAGRDSTKANNGE